MSLLGNIFGEIFDPFHTNVDPTTLYTPPADDDGNRLYSVNGKSNEEKLYIIAQVAYLYTCKYLSREDIESFIETGQLLVRHKQVVYVENKEKPEEKIKTLVTVPESAFQQPTRQVQSGKVNNQEILHLCDIDIGRLDKASRKKLQWYGVLFSWGREYGNIIPDANTIEFMDAEASKVYVATDDELRHAFNVQGYKEKELKELGLTPKKAAPKEKKVQSETQPEIEARQKCLDEVRKVKDAAKIHVKCAANIATVRQLLQEIVDYGYAVRAVCDSKSTEGTLGDVLPSILSIWLPDLDHQKIVLDAAHEATLKHNEAEAKKEAEAEAEKNGKSGNSDQKKKTQSKDGNQGNKSNASDKKKTGSQPNAKSGSPTAKSKDVMDFEVETPVEEREVSVDKAISTISERLKNDEGKLNEFLRDMGVYTGKGIPTMPFGELQEIATKYGVAIKANPEK